MAEFNDGTSILFGVAKLILELQHAIHFVVPEKIIQLIPKVFNSTVITTNYMKQAWVTGATKPRVDASINRILFSSPSPLEQI